MPHPLTHGIDSYFDEFFANRRRVATVLLVVCGVLSALLALMGRRVATELTEDPKRFGFEGPTEWVERIRLEESARRDVSGYFNVTYLTAESRKGGKKHRADPHAPPDPTEKPRVGTGEDEQDVLAKARMLELEGPIVRSEDLVIDRLVRPDYPEEARDKNIEGVVELVALVDTTGSVLQIQIVGGTHELMLEQAAAKAILQCRYRPYRVADQARRVWAAFRIAFSLY
jgi:TonB family protein